jgi:hypothetical protein
MALEARVVAEEPLRELIREPSRQAGTGSSLNLSAAHSQRQIRMPRPGLEAGQKWLRLRRLSLAG